jgi:WhiB family redox-sensing transcriptional regulator
VIPPLDYIPTQGWQSRAACAGASTTTFFPERGEPTRHAKAVCTSCPVRVDCLTAALDEGEHYGIFGGTSERERRTMRMAWPRRACPCCRKPIPHTPAEGMCVPLCDRCVSDGNALERMERRNRDLLLGIWSRP